MRTTKKGSKSVDIEISRTELNLIAYALKTCDYKNKKENIASDKLASEIEGLIVDMEELERIEKEITIAYNLYK